MPIGVVALERQQVQADGVAVVELEVFRDALLEPEHGLAHELDGGEIRVEIGDANLQAAVSSRSSRVPGRGLRRARGPPSRQP